MCRLLTFTPRFPNGVWGFGMTISNTGNATVDAMARVAIHGNVTSLNWFYSIVTKEGKPDRLAIDILGHLVWWYTPFEARDEQRGWSGLKKKFRGELYQCSYKALSSTLNAPERSIRRSLELLESLGLIRRVVRAAVLSDGSVLPSALFIDIYPEQIAKISQSGSGRTPLDLEAEPMSHGAAAVEQNGEVTSGLLKTNPDSLLDTPREQVSSLPNVENSQNQPEIGSDEGFENDKSAGQPLRPNKVTRPDLLNVENSDDQAVERASEPENAQASYLRISEKPQVNPCGQKRYPALPYLADYTNSPSNSPSSLLASSTEVGTENGAGAHAEASEQASKREGAYERFLDQFIGKVNDANREQTRKAYDAAVAKSSEEDVIDAFQLNKKAFIAEGPSAVREPYRYPLHWLTKYDGFEYWLGRLLDARRKGIPVFDELPRVEFHRTDAEGPESWIFRVYDPKAMVWSDFSYLGPEVKETPNETVVVNLVAKTANLREFWAILPGGTAKKIVVA